jgi:hypothetical protein
VGKTRSLTGNQEGDEIRKKAFWIQDVLVSSHFMDFIGFMFSC